MTSPKDPFLNDVLNGQVAVLSGGGSGITKDIAMTLGKHGAKIVILGRRVEVLKSTCEAFKSAGIAAEYFQCDVRKYDVCQKAIDFAVEKFGGVDILVNGAAGNFLCPIEGMSSNAFKTVIDIDLFGTFNLSKAALPALKQSKGCIINISATLHYTATPFQAHVSAAKAAIDSFTKSAALEWGTHGISVTGIAPGPIKDTEGWDRLVGGLPEEDVLVGIPLGRPGTCQDISLTTLFLATAGRYISGTTLVVDGGHWIGPRAPIALKAKL